MRIKALILGSVAALALAGCENMSDLERAGVGAATGAVIAGTTGGSIVTGAAIGGVAGALCDDVGVSTCN